jgi:hypothetical protein
MEFGSLSNDLGTGFFSDLDLVFQDLDIVGFSDTGFWGSSIIQSRIQTYTTGGAGTSALLLDFQGSGFTGLMVKH